jgi:hypothetical protein
MFVGADLGLRELCREVGRLPASTLVTFQWRTGGIGGYRGKQCWRSYMKMQIKIEVNSHLGYELD